MLNIVDRLFPKKMGVTSPKSNVRYRHAQWIWFNPVGRSIASFVVVCGIAMLVKYGFGYHLTIFEILLVSLGCGALQYFAMNQRDKSQGGR
jgi:hypothetical protein